MEKILIKQVTIVDTNSPFNGLKKDVLIVDGKVSEIADAIKKSTDKIYEGSNQMLSNGWIDMQASFCDPGFEQNETILSGLLAAANGGFTKVCPSPDTDPAISNKTQVDYLFNKSKSLGKKLPQILPIGTITQNREGKDISEMYDMMQAGAKGFSDYKRSIADAGLMQRALLYAKNIDATIMIHCNDFHLSHGGLMHEGIVSTKMGVKGMPAIAEEIELQRNLSLLAFTDSKLHVNTISTVGSVEMIRMAKQKGLKVTCGVAIANLLFTDEQVFDFDANYKLNPPLRSAIHQQALKDGLLDGTIDVIVSDHCPKAIESKAIEFDYADFGMLTIETFLPMLLQAEIGLSPKQLIEKLVNNPSKLLGLPLPTIEVGAVANFTLFDFETEWQYNRANKKSKGVNSVFIDKILKGKAQIII